MDDEEALDLALNGNANGSEVNGHSNGNAVEKDNSEDDEVEILGETSNGKKRKREKSGGAPSELSQLQARLRHLEGENRELRVERDFFQSRAVALEPSLKPSLVHTHEFEMDWEDRCLEQTSESYTVDGVEFSIKLSYRNRRAGVVYGGARNNECVVTPILETSDASPRFVLFMCTVTQRQRFGRESAQCSFDVQKFFEGGAIKCIGDDQKLMPTQELHNSKVMVRFTIVVQNVESPFDGADVDSTTIDVHGKEFRVSAAYLSRWSLYFRAYFAAEMAEKKKGVFPVKDADISADDFKEMLLIVFPTAKAITENNYLMLLKMASRFEMPDLRRRVEVFLMDFSLHSLPKAHLFRLAADKYDLQFVQAQLLHRWCDPELLRSELLTSHHYKKLQPVTQNLVNQHLAESSINTFGLRTGQAKACVSNAKICDREADRVMGLHRGVRNAPRYFGMNDMNFVSPDSSPGRSPHSSDDEVDAAFEAAEAIEAAGAFLDGNDV